MKIVSVCPYSFGANTYILVSGKDALVIDPSVSIAALERSLDEHNATLRGIVLTHGHFDHTVSVDTIRAKYPIPLMMHSGDAPMLTNGKINGFYDFYGQECTHRPAEKLLEDSDTLDLGNESISIINTPGHSPGSICLLFKDGERKLMITGDTLFADSVGRWDLWQGNCNILAASLKKLSSYDASTRIYAGHGADSTLGRALENAKYYLDF